MSATLAVTSWFATTTTRTGLAVTYCAAGHGQIGALCGCVYDAPTSPALVTRNGRVVRRIRGGTVQIEKVGCELFAVYGDEGGGLRMK